MSTQMLQVKNVDTVVLAVTVRDEGKSVLDPPELNGEPVDPSKTTPDPAMELEPYLKDTSKYVIELTVTDELGTTTYFGPRNYDVTGTKVLEIKHDMTPHDPAPNKDKSRKKR
jgi:hypothetical protein